MASEQYYYCEDTNAEILATLQNRLYHRYALSLSTDCIATVQGIPLRLDEISYGGFSAGCPSGVAMESLVQGKDYPANLQIFGDTELAIVRAAYVSKQRLGFGFLHCTAATLYFLRRSVEYMRKGASLVPKFGSPFLAHPHLQESQSVVLALSDITDGRPRSGDSLRQRVCGSRCR